MRTKLATLTVSNFFKNFAVIFYFLFLESNSGMFDQVKNLKEELKWLKVELKNKTVECDELQTKITLLLDAEKQAAELRQQL